VTDRNDSKFRFRVFPYFQNTAIKRVQSLLSS